jgi:nucleotide-binding universal stress UspA family protein
MSLKELLVHVDQTEHAVVRLRLAMDLACRHSCRLTALFVDEWNIGQPNSKPTQELAGDAHRASIQLRDELQSCSQKNGLEFEWQYVREFADLAVKKAAPYADICVLGHEGCSNSIAVDRNFCSNVMGTVGTPVVFVPKVSERLAIGREIVVAWDGSSGSVRAINSALALIEKADQVTVLNVDSGLHEQTAATLARLTERLRRHCPRTHARQIELQTSRSIGDALQSEALKLGGDLIVAGAFGHSRMTERLFGGVTRDLLERTSLPLLLTN